jgi:hypothetical protein
MVATGAPATVKLMLALAVWPSLLVALAHSG